MIKKEKIEKKPTQHDKSYASVKTKSVISFCPETQMLARKFSATPSRVGTNYSDHLMSGCIRGPPGSVWINEHIFMT